MSADANAELELEERNEMEELDADDHVKRFIRFRNPDNLPAIVTQMFLIVAALIVVIGLVYVVATIILITVHNFYYDRDPKKIPDFVKRSAQFSSDEDETDQEQEFNVVDMLEKRRGSDISVIPEQTKEWVKGKPTAAKKTQLLEKFMVNMQDSRHSH